MGNILYGVLGAYLEINEKMLYLGASIAQTVDNWDSLSPKIILDDPRDVRRWIEGMFLYYEQWYVGD